MAGGRRRRSPRGRRTPRVLAGLLALALAACCGPAAPAGAQEGSPAGIAPAADGAAGHGSWLAVGLLVGITQLDAGLADYQWNTGPRAVWGARVMAGAGRLAGGVRLVTTGTHQGLGGLAAPPTVRATSLELVGELGLADLGAGRVSASAAAGWLHLGYRPDRVTIPAAPGQTVEVELAPVDEWIAGGGLSLEHPLAGAWTAGLAVETRFFALDTARRAGDGIVLVRETFGDWSARLELARRFRRR